MQENQSSYILHPVFLSVVGAIFILGLVIVKLSLFGREKSYLNLLLTTAIAGIMWYALIYLLTNSGYLRQYPFLFNKGLPLYYLIGPCFYLYIRGSLNPAHLAFKKNDLLHLIIIIPAIISIIPYTIASQAQQQWVVDQVANNVRFAFSDSKYIVGSWHWFAFPLSAFIYTVMQLKLTVNTAKQKKHDPKVIRWIYMFTTVCGIIFLGMIAVNLTVLGNLNDTYAILHSSKLVLSLCLCLLFLSGLFFINPAFLYGFVQANTLSGNENVTLKRKSKPLEEFESIRVNMYDNTLVVCVENYINRTEAFRKTGFTISELASALEVPNHKLSDLFNNHYQLNFNTYINNLRIEYVKERLEAGEWRQFTLEAIAQDAGFSSRNTFFLAFKKVMDTTPSNYLTMLKQASVA